MSLKQIPFAEARRDLSSIVERVRQSGKPVAITKRGKPAAILVDPETFERRLGASPAEWTLRGSGRWIGDAEDIDEAIRAVRSRFRLSSKKRLSKLEEAAK